MLFPGRGFLLGRFVLLLAIGAVTTASGQIYEFKGYIDRSTSLIAPLGSEVEFRLTLKSPSVAIFPPGQPDYYIYRELSSWSLKIDAVEYAIPEKPGPLVINYAAPFNPYGIMMGWGRGSFVGGLNTFQMNWYTVEPLAITPEGLLIGGIPISAFSFPGGSIIEDTYYEDNSRGSASWIMTSYSVKINPINVAVPEPSTFGVFGVCLLIGLGIFKRRR